MALSQCAALIGDVPPAAGKVRPQGRREEQAQGGSAEGPLGEQIHSTERNRLVLTSCVAKLSKEVTVCHGRGASRACNLTSQEEKEAPAPGEMESKGMDGQDCMSPR
uniref:Uncharacterized protein n=1 Tax=Knipowitschia caucasica TaxID=637954 RepID=A0AAV2JHN2_KNICA